MSRYRVEVCIDGARKATVEIDRDRLLFTVRPLRRRTTYTLPLSTVAELVAWRVLRSGHPIVAAPSKIGFRGAATLTGRPSP